MDKRQTQVPFKQFDLDNIARAKVLAMAVHSNQMYGSMDYIKHCEAVVDVLRSTGFNTPEHIQVGWLHDCIEDSSNTEVTATYIQRFFSDTVYQAVLAITKLPDESYEDYILKVKGNRLALEVKMADNTVNLKNSMLEYIADRTEGNGCRVLKYGKIRTALERSFIGEDLDFSYDEDEDYYPQNGN